MRGGWLDPDAPGRFARYCDRVMERFGDRIAVAVTMNEPNLARLLTWIDLPAGRPGPRAGHAAAASEAAGVEGTGWPTSCCPRRWTPWPTDGRRSRAARAAIKARRADLPVGLSLAIVDDVVGRRRPDRCATASGPRCTTAGSSWPATTTSSESRTTSGSATTAPGPSRRRTAYRATRWARGGARVAGRRRALRVRAWRGCPVLVTEHGMATPDDTLRAGFIEPSLRGCST